MNKSLTFSTFLDRKTFPKWPKIVVLFRQYHFWSERIFYKALLFVHLSPGNIFPFQRHLLPFPSPSHSSSPSRQKSFPSPQLFTAFPSWFFFSFSSFKFPPFSSPSGQNNFLLQKFMHFHHCFPSPFTLAELPRIVFLLCSACVLSIFLSNLFKVQDEDIKVLWGRNDNAPFIRPRTIKRCKVLLTRLNSAMKLSLEQGIDRSSRRNLGPSVS